MGPYSPYINFNQKQTMGPSAIAGISSGVQSAGSIFGQIAANRANKKMHQKQLDWNEEMWHMQNEYNSPAAQMQRFREAGLNTHLMYGQGESGNAGPVQGNTPPVMQNIGGGIGGATQSAIGSYIALKKADAEIENIQSSTALNLNEADKAGMQTEGIAIDNKRSYLEYQVATGTAGERIKQSQIKTVSDGLELVRQGLVNEQLTKQNAIATIELAYAELFKILEASRSEADLKGTILENAMKAQDWDYRRIHKMNMGTHSALTGILTDILAPEGTKVAGSKAQRGVNWGMQGVRQAIVRGKAGGGIGGMARGFGFSGKFWDAVSDGKNWFFDGKKWKLKGDVFFSK